MDGAAQLIEKYKARLTPENDFKKKFRALLKLKEMEMTLQLLQTTNIGRVVQGLRKTKGLGDLAKEIVTKWKRIASQQPPQEQQPRSSSKQEYVPRSVTTETVSVECTRPPSAQAETVEYDPAQNWAMTKCSYEPAVKQERVDDEYDPSRNWQMENGADSSSRSPLKKSSQVKQKKRKRQEEEGNKSSKIRKKDASREAELIATLQRTQEELMRIKKEKIKSEEVKVGKKSSERERELESPPQNGEIEQYDPQDNYEVSNSPPSTYDPRSSESSQTHQPSAQDEEYSPGAGDASTSYQPSVTYDPEPSRTNEQHSEDEDSEGSYEEGEPGAYLLHPRRASTEINRGRPSGTSYDVKDSVKSFVQSQTMYQRSSSVDSEDGKWGSKVNGVKVEKHNSSPDYEEPPETVTSIPDKSVKHNNRAEMKPDKSAKKASYDKKQKRTEKSTKPQKIKKEVNPSSSEKSQTSRDLTNKKINSNKQKVNKDSSRPDKKVKGEKSEVKDAGFLFQGIPDVPKTKKKKKTNKIRRDNNTVTAVTAKPKLDLHLPQIQTSYRPLPSARGGVSEKKNSAGMSGLTDNEAAELHSTRQTKKMLVYSGSKGSVLPKMMSLYDQCMHVLMNNIDAIGAFGGIPFEIVQPILKKCSPAQLYHLEDCNPYLLEDTNALWEHHAVREFRGKTPDELETWRELYWRLSDERDVRLRNLTHSIQVREAKKIPEKKVMLAYVGANAKPPRSVRRAQEKYGTAAKGGSSLSSASSSGSSTSAVRRELVSARMAVPEGSITAASVDREDRMSFGKAVRKPRVAPLMAKTLKSIGKFRYKR